MASLQDTAKRLFARGNGILAADESTGTATKRLESIGVASTEETRRQYRELFLHAEGIEKYLSGVILYEETVNQSNNDDVNFVDHLKSLGIEPGIKLDTGREPFGDHGEDATTGLDTLAERAADMASRGLTFAKWRAAIQVSDALPSNEAVRENAKRMAQYAKICQEAGLVPIVEPEVLMASDHTIERKAEVMEQVLTALFEEMATAEVDLTGAILKTSIATPGSESNQDSNAGEVAEVTLKVLRDTVPPELAGIVFLSGGLSSVKSILYLNEMDKMRDLLPWPLTFSFARGLQVEALNVWDGKDENIEAARKVFLERAAEAAEATEGDL
jgi:fructose-bisphosphate aldolase class I